MLKKLRLRFVGINMSIVLVILCTIFGVLLHTTHANLERESVEMVTAVAADPLQLNWPDTASRLPYFTVRISPYGSVRVSGTSYYDLSDEQVLSGIVTAALRSGGEQGLLHDYSLRYLRTTWRGNEYIIFADVSNYEEAVRAVEMGADIVGPTLYGYTEATKHIEQPDLREFARMCRDFKDKAYVIMEGHIYSPEDAMKCIFLGAHSVVVGSAITRPHLITKRFTDLLTGYQNNWREAERSKH